MLHDLLIEIKEHLRKHRAPYIVAAILSLTTSLFLVVWNYWLFQFLAQRSAAVPRRALGAAIGLLILWLIVSMVLVVFYARRPKHQTTIASCDHAPLLQELRSKIVGAKTDNEMLRRENGVRCAQLQEANAESKRLNDQIKEVTHHDLDDTDNNILRLIGLSKYNKPWANFIAEELNLHIEVVKLHLNKLVKTKYIVSVYNDGLYQYGFADKGREYAIKNKLL